MDGVYNTNVNMTQRNDLIIGMVSIMVASLLINLLLQWVFDLNYTVLHIYGLITIILNLLLIVGASIKKPKNENTE